MVGVVYTLEPDPEEKARLLRLVTYNVETGFRAVDGVAPHLIVV